MDAEALKEAVALAGGEEHIVAFMYDNSGRTMFIDEPFSLSMIQGNFVVFKDYDLSGVELTTLKPIETIQTILTVQNAEDRKRIDKHYIRN